VPERLIILYLGAGFKSVSSADDASVCPLAGIISGVPGVKGWPGVVLLRLAKTLTLVPVLLATDARVSPRRTT